MRQQAKNIIKHPLIYGSTIVVLGGLIANFFNFLFNLYMSRSLSISDYGILASVMSLIGFPALFISAIIPVVVRFAGDYFALNNFPLLRGLYVKIKKLLFYIAIVFFVCFLYFIPSISGFFHIENKIILILADLIIFFTIIGVINMAFLQAKLAFTFQVLVGLVNALLKFSVGILLVNLGYSISGAVFAMVIAGVSSYFFSFIPLKFIFDRKIILPTIKIKELISYGIPSSLTLFGLTSFISVDIMLVKHFFDPHQAGLYAGLSLISRAIFYLSAPIGTVMFPLIVQKHSKSENFTNTFKISLLLVFVPSLLLTIFYSFFPKFSILFFLKNQEYLAINSLLVPFAIYISLYSLLSIISNFYLSIKKTKVFLPIILGAILQVTLIYFYHHTFLQIISISLAITFLLVTGLLLYYPYATKNQVQA